MRAIRVLTAIATLAVAASPMARAADTQQCRAEEGLRQELVSLRQEGKTGDEATQVIAKQLMAQNPPALGLALYLEPLALEVFLLGNSPSRIVADCYRDASDRPAEIGPAALTADQRGAIGDHVRECWTRDPNHPDFAQMHVMLQVTTDAAGVARVAKVAGDDQARLGDPVFHAFAERAVRAVLDPQCANLPLPQTMLGNASVVTFRFSP
jgi:hypothetical protein